MCVILSLVIVIIFAILTQLILFKTSKVVGNPYSKKMLVVASVINVTLYVKLFCQKNMINIENIRGFINPGIILLVTSLLVSITIIDFIYYEIPNEYNFTLLVLGLGFIANNPQVWKTCLLGGLICLIAYIILYFVARGNIGMGDVKLATCLGILLGLGGFKSFMLLSFFVGAIISGVLLLFKIKKKDDKIAFGPFISFAFLLILLGIRL